MIKLTINGKEVAASEGITVASAIVNAGEMSFRQSVSGEPRAPLCGMGVCFECRVTINGVDHVRSCVTPVEDDMEVVTGG